MWTRYLYLIITFVTENKVPLLLISKYYRY